MDAEETTGYIVVVTCVVVRTKRDAQAETLIIKRSDMEDEGPGLWTVPGGKLEEEDWGKPVSSASNSVQTGVLERAVLREVKEETGVSVEAPLYLKERGVVFVRTDGMPTAVVKFCALCREDAFVSLGAGAVAYAWVSGDELDHYQFIGNVKDDIKVALDRFDTS